MSGINQFFNKLSGDIADLLYPRKCPFCRNIVGKALICEDCSKSLPYCTEVREGADFGRVTAPLYYEGAVREAILHYKFDAQLGGLDLFGQMMAECAADRYSGAFDAVTWVPVSSRRLRKRGFDQARYLAASLCVDWHVMPQETLRKTVDNPAQSGLDDRAARRANVLGVYEAVKPEDIAGKRFLLVDDICTTGSTLGECARTLRAAGAADVICLTLAMVPKEKSDVDGMLCDRNEQNEKRIFGKI